MRIPGVRRKDPGVRFAPPPTQTVCPVCSLRNDATARFCRNCGLPLGAPRDPVRGTTTRRADLPSERGTGIAAIVGLLAVVVILAGAGFLIFRGFNSGTAVVPSPGASARVSHPPGTSTVPSTSEPTAQPSSDASPGSTAEPSPNPTAEPTPQPTDEPTAEPIPTPKPPPGTDTGFTCDTAAVLDASRSSWRVTRALWGARDKWDEFTIELSRESGRAPKPGTQVSIAWLDPKDIKARYGLPKPSGDRALVVSFDGPAIVRQAIVNPSVGLQAIDSIDIDMDDSGVLRAVIGVNGNGCARLTAPDWVDGAAPDQIKLVLDVKYR